METLYRYINALVMGVVSLFAPIRPIVCCALLFVLVDFVTGTAASRVETRKQGREWYFESHEAWRTLLKAGFVVTAIGMMWLVESCILNFMELHLTRMFAGMVCGVEMWSVLENASLISDARLFGWLRRYVRHRMKKEIERYENQ